jgi:hypothetical protein
MKTLFLPPLTMTFAILLASFAHEHFHAGEWFTGAFCLLLAYMHTLFSFAAIKNNL